MPSSTTVSPVLHLPSPRVRRASHQGVFVVAVASAVLLGALAGSGFGRPALALAAVAAVIAFTLSRPVAAALVLLTLVPFLPYGLNAGGYSLYLGIPGGLLVGGALLLRCWGSEGWRPTGIGGPVVLAFLLVVGASAILSANPATGLTRLISLATFLFLAWALATAITSGLVRGEHIVGALVLGATLAGIALIGQFVAQFGLGKQTVLNWLYDVRPLLQGERAGSTERSNWYLSDFQLLRAVFPYMAPPSAGQYTVFGLLGAIWLRRRSHEGGDLLRRAMLLAIPILAIALLVTFSRQAWVGAAVGLALLALHRRPGVLIAAVLPLALVMMLVPVPGQSQTFADYLLTAGDTSTVATNQRINLWNQAFEIIPGNAPLGVGPGQYGSLNPDPIGNPIFYAHNVFLDHIVELGIVGGMLFILLAMTVMVTAWRRGSWLAVALLGSWLAANFFDDTFYFPRNGLALAAVGALIVFGERTRPPDRGRAEDPVEYEPAPHVVASSAGVPVLAMRATGG